MKTATSTPSNNRNILYIALVTAGLLLVPLAAMQFTNSVAWSVLDFVTAGVLLFGTGLAYELMARRVRSGQKRALVGVVLFAALLLIWAELAVGIFGN